MSNLVEEMPLTLLDMAKPMTDDGNDTDVSQDHSAFSGFSRNDLPSHGERAKYSSFTTGDLPDLAMELERTEGLPPLEAAVQGGGFGNHVSATYTDAFRNEDVE